MIRDYFAKYRWIYTVGLAFVFSDLTCNALPLPPNEVWVCLRGVDANGDLVIGDGKVDNPFNGSTQPGPDPQPGLDAAMTYAYNNHNTIVNFAKGDYTSNKAWGVSSGCKIRGAGKADTKFTFTAWGVGPTPEAPVPPPFTAFDCYGDDIEVSNLSIDLPLAAPKTTTGVSIKGDRGTIRNVHVTHPHGDGHIECFAIGIGSYNASNKSVGGALIEGCEVDQFFWPGTAGALSGTMIMAGNDGSIGANSTPGGTTATGVIRNCYVHDCDCIAYGTGGTLNFIVRDNYSNNCWVGFNHDSWKSNGDQILKNRFMNCTGVGISAISETVNPGPIKDLLIDGNICSLTNVLQMGQNLPSPSPNDHRIISEKYGYYIDGIISGLITRNNIVTYNEIEIETSNKYTGLKSAFVINITSDIIAENNHCSPVFGNQFESTSGKKLLLHNTNLDGTLMYSSSTLNSDGSRSPMADQGWLADTGTSSKTSHNTETVSELGNARSIKAIKDVLMARGIIRN